MASTGAVAGDFTQTRAKLTIAAGAATSAGTVTVRAVDNAVATESKQVTVSATVAGDHGVANPANATLTLTDDDTPQATLVLSSSSMAESGGIAPVTVVAAAVSPAVAGSARCSSSTTIWARGCASSCAPCAAGQPRRRRRGYKAMCNAAWGLRGP